MSDADKREKTTFCTKFESSEQLTLERLAWSGCPNGKTKCTGCECTGYECTGYDCCGKTQVVSAAYECTGFHCSGSKRAREGVVKCSIVDEHGQYAPVHQRVNALNMTWLIERNLRWNVYSRRDGSELSACGRRGRRGGGSEFYKILTHPPECVTWNLFRGLRV